MKSTGRFTPELKKLKHYSFDHCSRCHQKLPEGVAAYAGYGDCEEPLYVGDCCKTELLELASHIYWWWESYKRPKPITSLWRYMDFSKFVSLISNKALYFSRADLLGDPFEGARGIASRETEWQKYCLDYFREAILTVPGGPQEKTSEEVDQEAERLYLDFSKVGEREIRNTFVTCWHENDNESEAFWRLYCPPNSAGVAINTCFEALDTALNYDLEVKFGHVQYIDFKESFAGTYDRVFWKRKSLNHEAEVRGVIKFWQNNEPVPGLLVPVNVDKLISKVVISPFSPPWFEKVLKETMQKFDVDASVENSELISLPFF